jgi:catechol 2,3-dioxygenase-like lactoylglutathione lyase family enzyme
MQFGYTVIFVPDVTATVDFFEQAFGVQRKFVTPAFAALDTGSTVLAFGSEDNERKELGRTTAFRPNSLHTDPAGVQLSFIADDIQAAFHKAR